VLDSDHVILETIKKDESGDAWIVRVYEYKQCRSAAVRLTFIRPILRAVECNLVEEGEQPVAHDGPCLSFPIQPYEIKTFKVWL
jgi:alpha-mannosidase